MAAPRLAKIRNRTRGQRGSTLVEFAIVMIALVPFVFGLVAMGITLGRGVQAAQVTRDVGHMYGMGADFSTLDAQEVVAHLAEDFSLDPSTGSAVLILSRIQRIFPADCAAIGATCTNNGLHVFTQRVVLGNRTLRTSAFGTPPSQYVRADGNINSVNYLQQSSLVATGFQNILTLNAGDIAWLAEGFFKQPDLNFLNPGFRNSNDGTYIRVIF